MAFFPTRVRRLALSGAAALALGLTACSGDSSGPSTFDPAATSTDLAAVDAAFSSPAVQALVGAGAAIDSVASGGAVSATLSAVAQGADAESFTGAQAYARQITRLLPAARPTGLALAGGIPDTVLGKTFVYDSLAAHYVVSDRTGAPANGVRFVLYAVGLDGRPANPLNEIGYADLTDESTGTSKVGRLVVVSDGVTYLDYRVSGTATSTGGTVTIKGYVTDGTTRANFDLLNSVAMTGSGITLSVDYGLSVPSRSLALDVKMVLTGLETGGTATLDLSLSGPHGDVSIEGTGHSGSGTADGSYTVRVNGDLFATITTGSTGTSSTVTVTDANGDPLTDAEQQALEDVFGMVGQGLEAFGNLLEPVGAWIGAMAI